MVDADTGEVHSSQKNFEKHRKDKPIPLAVALLGLAPLVLLTGGFLTVLTEVSDFGGPGISTAAVLFVAVYLVIGKINAGLMFEFAYIFGRVRNAGENGPGFSGTFGSRGSRMLLGMWWPLTIFFTIFFLIAIMVLLLMNLFW